jgi:hypothetical protein
MVSTALTFVLLMLAPAADQTASPSQTAPPDAAGRDLNLRAYVELLRTDVRAQKVAILTDVMQFTEAEDTAFWPVYREYELELSKLQDERVSLIRDYGRNYDELTNDVADKLATRALDIETRRTQLLGKYYNRFRSVLSARTAARFLQVEHQLLLLVELQIASMLPVVP